MKPRTTLTIAFSQLTSRHPRNVKRAAVDAYQSETKLLQRIKRIGRLNLASGRRLLQEAGVSRAGARGWKREAVQELGRQARLVLVRLPRCVHCGEWWIENPCGNPCDDMPF